MSIADELEKLSQLKQDGLLSEEEFEAAKSKVISGPTSKQTPPTESNTFRQITEQDNSIGNAANKYVTFQIIMGIIGVIIFLVFASKMLSNSPRLNRGPSFSFPSQR